MTIYRIAYTEDNLNLNYKYCNSIQYNKMCELYTILDAKDIRRHKA